MPDLQGLNTKTHSDCVRSPLGTFHELRLLATRRRAGGFFFTSKLQFRDIRNLTLINDHHLGILLDSGEKIELKAATATAAAIAFKRNAAVAGSRDTRRDTD